MEGVCMTINRGESTVTQSVLKPDHNAFFSGRSQVAEIKSIAGLADPITNKNAKEVINLLLEMINYFPPEKRDSKALQTMKAIVPSDDQSCTQELIKQINDTFLSVVNQVLILVKQYQEVVDHQEEAFFY